MYSLLNSVQNPNLRNRPTNETTNPYGKTKQLLEKIIQDYSKFGWLHAINLRYFNPIGAHPSGFIWETPNGIPNNLLPYIFQVANGKRDHLRIFGDDYPTPDGTGIRDYIDINDLIDGHLKAFQNIDKIKTKYTLWKGSCCAINLWTGKWASVLEILHTVEKILNKKIPYQIYTRRTGDLAEIYAIPTLAKSLLWWEANTPIEESLQNVVNFLWL